MYLRREITYKDREPEFLPPDLEYQLVEELNSYLYRNEVLEIFLQSREQFVLLLSQKPIESTKVNDFHLAIDDIKQGFKYLSNCDIHLSTFGCLEYYPGIRNAIDLLKNINS